MNSYDAIVVGAGHNGLTAAALLQRAGLRTVCLEGNTYCGGMAATVELIDGFRHEIAGSVQFPTPSQITKDLGLDTLPTVDPDVMSVNIGEAGEEPMIFYRDPIALMTHLGEKHGADAVTGMAQLIGWSQGPARALGRFEVRTPPKTLDEMYACAANADERRAIHEMLFGSAMDVIDRYLPDKDKHVVIRGMLAFLAVNSTYRGPYTPGSAACLAFALAVPDQGAAMMTKLQGGIGVLTEHLREVFVSHGGEIRFRTKAEEILVQHGAVTGVRLRDGSTITAPVVVSNLAPDVTVTNLIAPENLPPELSARLSGRDHRASFVQIHFALDGLPEFAPPYEVLNEPACSNQSESSGHQKNSNGSGRPVGTGSCRTTRRWACRYRQCTTPVLRHRASMQPVRSPMPSRSRPVASSTVISRTRWPTGSSTKSPAMRRTSKTSQSGTSPSRRITCRACSERLPATIATGCCTPI